MRKSTAPKDEFVQLRPVVTFSQSPGPTIPIGITNEPSPPRLPPCRNSPAVPLPPPPVGFPIRHEVDRHHRVRASATPPGSSARGGQSVFRVDLPFESSAQDLIEQHIRCLWPTRSHSSHTFYFLFDYRRVKYCRRHQPVVLSHSVVPDSGVSSIDMPSTSKHL